jgi:hypothetical protein
LHFLSRDSSIRAVGSHDIIEAKGERVRRVLVLFLVFMAFTGAACSKSGVDPNKFATDVCTAAKDWVDTIQQGAATFGGGLTAESSPEQIRDGLVGFLDEAITETDELIGEVEEAGVPAVDGGEEASETLLDAFQRVKTAFEEARADAQALPVEDQQAFMTGAQELGTTVQQALTEIGTELEDQENPDLQGEFDENEACTELQNAGGA